MERLVIRFKCDTCFGRELAASWTITNMKRGTTLDVERNDRMQANLVVEHNTMEEKTPYQFQLVASFKGFGKTSKVFISLPVDNNVDQHWGHWALIKTGIRWVLIYISIVAQSLVWGIKMSQSTKRWKPWPELFIHLLAPPLQPILPPIYFTDVKQKLSVQVTLKKTTTHKPHNGTCDVYPKKGQAAMTKFRANCEKWRADDDGPMMYEFRFTTSGKREKVDMHSFCNSLFNHVNVQLKKSQ